MVIRVIRGKKKVGMKNVVVTGAAGFVGKNLVVALQRLEDISLLTITSDDDQSVLEKALLEADVIFHLAGVNRPKSEDEFATGNAGLTNYITNFLEQNNKTPRIVLPSSSQAALNNPYGKSKKEAEDAVLGYHEKTPVQLLRCIVCPVCLVNGPGPTTIRWWPPFVITLPVVLILLYLILSMSWSWSI